MKTRLTLLAVALAAAVAVAGPLSRVESTVPGADSAPVRAIPAIEAERRAAAPATTRTDTGALTPEMLAASRGAVTTRSKNFVLEGLGAGRAELPIAGARARVAVFSATDAGLDARLAGPDGAEVALTPFSRDDLADRDELSKVVAGRGEPGEGTLLLSRDERLAPGRYTLDVRGAAQPVDVVVRDEGGPELVLSMPETGFDRRRPVTIRASLVEGGAPIAGARLVARARGAKGRGVRFAEVEPGRYEATIPAARLASMATFVVEARATTAAGLAVLRHGTIGTLTGDARADLVAAAPAVWTESDVAVAVEVEVAAAGRYYVRGNLVGAGGEPVAWAQDARELSPGRHTLTLRFARETVERAGESDLVLSDVFLMNVTEAPGVKAPTTIDARPLG